MKNARVVVSVAFSRRDFERVAECAEKMGMRTSEFVREAALDRALCQSLVVRLSSFSGSPGSAFFTNKPVPHTRAWGATAPLKEAEERALTA
ncbi:MAG: hypothetical protein HY690_10585 [Chloroflexi bacterium]|nr:hypothetical protein [Chloroflexota bacterium]